MNVWITIKRYFTQGCKPGTEKYNRELVNASEFYLVIHDYFKPTDRTKGDFAYTNDRELKQALYEHKVISDVIQ